LGGYCTNYKEELQTKEIEMSHEYRFAYIVSYDPGRIEYLN